MKLNSLITFHINNIKVLDFDSAGEYLIGAGFIRIGCGCESVVYSRKGFDYVIKLQYMPFSTTGINHYVPNEHSFIPTISINTKHFTLIIQKKVEQTVCSYICSHKNSKKYYTIRKKFRKFVSRMEKLYNVSDLHDENVGILNGKFVIFDWNLHC